MAEGDASGRAQVLRPRAGPDHDRAAPPTGSDDMNSAEITDDIGGLVWSLHTDGPSSNSVRCGARNAAPGPRRLDAFSLVSVASPGGRTLPCPDRLRRGAGPEGSHVSSRF